MEKKNTGLIITIVVLSLIIGGLGGFIIYDKVLSKDNNKVAETIENGDSVKDNSTNNNMNNYSLYSENLKNEINSKYGLSYQTQSINSDFVGRFNIILNENNELYIKYEDEKYLNKFGNYKISDNVLNYYLINTGQNGGNTLYYIKLDGSVSKADIEYGVVNGEDIKVENNIGEYKDIVTIIGGVKGDESSGVHTAIFIDVNGNMYF